MGSHFLILVESAGILVFALSGAMAAARKQMDIFGFLVLALMPAVGGGTIRDLILDVPVFWVEDHLPIWITVAAALIVWFGERHIESRKRAILWADAFGLAFFAVVGARKAWLATGDHLIAVVMGVTTGVAGGMIRDVIANEVPLILQREIYATAAFAGALMFALLTALHLPGPITISLSVAVAFTIRASAVAFGWTLPGRKPRPPA